MGFEVLDISGDVGLRVRGQTLREAFSTAAVGMYSLITDLNAVKETKTIKIAIKSHSLEGLLVAWLNELIFHFDAYGFTGRKVEIERLEDYNIMAEITGEEFDPEMHERKLLLKAATYHNLKVENKNGFWQFEVIFDI